MPYRNEISTFIAIKAMIGFLISFIVSLFPFFPPILAALIILNALIELLAYKPLKAILTFSALWFSLYLCLSSFFLKNYISAWCFGAIVLVDLFIFESICKKLPSNPKIKG